MINDEGTEDILERFFSQRQSGLWNKLRGLYRAEVVETNDPLILGRIRVRIPELHDRNLRPEECPWAVKPPGFGSPGAGTWGSFNIGDIVFIAFEKEHPYAPVCLGGAYSTRRESYPLRSVHGETPLSVKPDGKPDRKPDDYIKDYLPHDGRPMSLGFRDRYGTEFVSSSVGFFPIEHQAKAAPTGTDGISNKDFELSQLKPEVNDPDMKFVALTTKYGNSITLVDIGYKWENEFTGDYYKDKDFEVKRNNYYTRLYSEDEYKDKDQRRIEIKDRYGNKIEMRSVGWYKSRKGEFSDDEVVIGDVNANDQRWIKIKSKAGNLFQLIDKGSDPNNNVNVKRLLSEETGESDGESEWDDARQIRLLTAYGIKMVLDDRGSDKVDPLANPTPGNGMLLRGRKPFAMEFNEKDLSNRMLMYTPKSKGLEFNDRFDYVMLCSNMSGSPSVEWAGTADNEFSKSTFRRFTPEDNTYHILMDNANKYSRYMTPMQQGIELHDGSISGTWAQMKDSEGRALWMSKDNKVSVWKDNTNNLYVALDDGGQQVIVKNKAGRIQIHAAGDVDIISDNTISLSGETINIKAKSKIVMNGAAGQMIIDGAGVGTPNEFKAGRHIGFFPGLSAGGGATNGTGRGAKVNDVAATDIPIIKPSITGRSTNTSEQEMSKELSDDIFK